MSAQEFAPQTGDIIHGRYTDIVLDNQDGALVDVLENDYGPTTLYRMHADGLRYPIDHAVLEFYKDSPTDLNLYANVGFDSFVVRAQDVDNWQSLIAGNILNKLHGAEFETMSLGHQKDDFYIRLNDVHAMHVQFNTTTLECNVSTSLETLSQLVYASEGNLRFDPDPDYAQIPEHIDVLRRFASMWSIVIDTVTSELGSPEQDKKGKSKIVVSAHPFDPSDMNEPEPGKELALRGASGPSDIEMSSSDNEGFNMIGGLTHAKQKLQEIGDMFKDPVGSYEYGLSATHFLLHGPPGTGKTTLINAFAHELGAKIWPVDSTSLVDMWVGNSGKNVRNLFKALKEQPAGQLIVVFMDEFDAVAKKGNTGTRERTDIIKQLNMAIDEITKRHKNIIIAAATNADIDDLEPALVRSGRIEPIGAPAPDELERVDVWAAVLAQSYLSFCATNEHTSPTGPSVDGETFIPYEDDINPVELARLTDGFTGADFETMLTRARKKQFQLYRRTGKKGRVSHADLIEEIRTFVR